MKIRERKLINFVEIGEIYIFYGNRGDCTICIIDLGGMDAPVDTTTL